VFGGEGEDLNLFLSFAGESGRVEEHRRLDVDSDDFVVALELPRGVPGASFLRAELDDNGTAVSNPIFF